MSAAVLAKPAPNEKGVLPYSDVIAYLEQRYDFNADDFRGAKKFFGQWCERRGYAYRQADGAQQQAWFQEFMVDPQGERAEPPMEKFWHWLLDFMSPPGCFKVPKTFKLDIDKVLQQYDKDIAPERALRAAGALQAADSVRAQLPAEFQQALDKQMQSIVSGIALPDFVRTILGHMKAEYGPKLKLGFDRP
jgi:hypothetical protein